MRSPYFPWASWIATSVESLDEVQSYNIMKLRTSIEGQLVGLRLEALDLRGAGSLLLQSGAEGLREGLKSSASNPVILDSLVIS